MRARLQRFGALLAATALATGASLVVLGGTAGATTYTVTNTADDGSATALRDVIENQATSDGDVVVLTAGATYVLDGSDCSDLDVMADITIQSSSTTLNATIQQTCDDEEVIANSDTSTDLVVRNVNVTGGSDDDDGGGINVGDDLTLINAQVFGNVTNDDSGGIEADNITIISSTISGNCAEDDGGAMEVNGDLTMVNSDVVANTHDDGADCGAPVGGGSLAEELEDAAEAPEPDADDDDVEPADVGFPANIGLGDGGLQSFGSVIALAIDPGETPFNCDNGDGTTSSGYNFSDDDTCGFTNVATGDRENAGDPGLGELADNGGPTPTLLPAATSPLVNFIPIAACGGGDELAEFAVTTDQRGIARPQDVGCEIGSVELEFELVVLFTG